MEFPKFPPTACDLSRADEQQTFISRNHFVLLGLLATSFFLVHAGTMLSVGQAGNLLWSCHVANLMVAVGWYRASRVWNGVGLLMLTIGLPMWVVHLSLGGKLLPTSVVTHVGGLILAALGARQLGEPRGDWWKALAVQTSLVIAARWTTEPSANVNLAFASWPTWLCSEPAPSVQLILAIVVWGVLLWSVERLWSFLGDE